MSILMHGVAKQVRVFLSDARSLAELMKLIIRSEERVDGICLDYNNAAASSLLVSTPNPTGLREFLSKRRVVVSTEILLWLKCAVLSDVHRVIEKLRQNKIQVNALYGGCGECSQGDFYLSVSNLTKAKKVLGISHV